VIRLAQPKDKLQNVSEALYSCLGRIADKVPDRMLVDSGLTSVFDDHEWSTCCSIHFTPGKESLIPTGYEIHML
jgi:hypothetical protein